jgi:hypothetical protein
MDLESDMKIHPNTIAVKLGSASLIAMVLATPALAKKEISPYLEFNQIVSADLKNGGDVLTYSTVAAGIDASVANSRSEGQISYRYERRIGYGKNKIGDSDVHSGLARGRYEVVPNLLSIEAGALAARTRTDNRGAAPGLLVGNVDNISQIYSVYAGPTLTTSVGDVNVGAAYRVGYTAVDSNGFTPAPGQPRVDNFDDSVSHLATASVGMESGVLPFGWSVSGAYEREDAGQLKQRFESKNVHADIVVPITPTVAAVGGVGYEKIEASSRLPLLDAGGNPVVDGKGRFVTDPASPRVLAYDQDGIYWDVGVAWKPSRRTNLEARVGRRYGSISYTGSFAWQVDSSTAFSASVYDDVQTFGQQLGDGLSRLPTSFTTSSNPLSPGFGGCVFGSGGTSGGGCLNPALSSINSSVFRSRGATAALSRSRGPWTYGAGIGYSQRKYQTPGGAGFALNGVRDEDWFGQAQVGYQISPQSSIDAEVFASLYDSGILGAPNVLSTGATSSFHQQFGRRLSGVAAVGLYSSRVEGQDGDLFGSALLGMRYTF